MDYRLRKQIIIGFVYILLFCALGFGIYYLFIYNAPSCSDNIKNQGEEEIDCGGPCDVCVPFQDIAVTWVEVVKAGQSSYDFVAKIRNPNPNFGTTMLKYQFIAKDASGAVIGRRDGKTFILPDSSKYLIENNFESSQMIDSAEVIIEKIVKADWQKLDDYETLDIFVKDKNFQIKNDSTFLGEAAGTVKNNTSFGFDRMHVNVVLFGDGQKVLGASQSEIRTLGAGENRFFSTKWYWPLAGDVRFVDMEPETNVFSDENYMRIHGIPEE